MNKYMELAIKEAAKAKRKNEVPVGCVIVKENKIIAKAHNLIEKNRCSLDHAEMIAIRKASKKNKNWRLIDCDLYVTLEPCEMCKNAIFNSRINKVYYCVDKNNYNVKKTKINLIKLEEYEKEEQKKIHIFFSKIR